MGKETWTDSIKENDKEKGSCSWQIEFIDDIYGYGFIRFLRKKPDCRGLRHG